MARLIALIVAILIHVPVVAQDALRKDGNWWRGLDNASQLYYLIGNIDGRINGATFATAAGCLAAGAQDKAQECLDRINRAVRPALEGLTKKPYSQFRDGLNQLFADFKNRSICVEFGMNVVTRQIEGLTQKDAEDWLERLRATASKDQC